MPRDVAVKDVAGSAEQVWRTKAQLAVAKLSFGAGCDPFDGRESERRRVPTGGDRLAVTLSQQGDHLLNLDDLFGRGKDERGEALPVVLPEQSQAGQGGDGVLHRLVFRKRADRLAKVEAGIQIFFEPSPVVGGGRGLGGDTALGQAQSHPTLADDAFPRLAKRLPTERLPTRQRCPEVVVLDGERFRFGSQGAALSLV